MLVTIRFRGARAASSPRTAVLIASVPPPVKSELRIGAADEARDLRAGLVDRLPGELAEAVHAGRVAVALRQVDEHRLNDFRRGAGGGVVVEVGQLHRGILRAGWAAMPRCGARIRDGWRRADRAGELFIIFESSDGCSRCAGSLL